MLMFLHNCLMCKLRTLKLKGDDVEKKSYCRLKCILLLISLYDCTATKNIICGALFV